MKVLAVSHLFPNRLQPNFGVFVKERLRHVAKQVNLSVVAPIPCFPFMDYTEKYKGLSAIEEEEKNDGLQVFHPRYFMIPKYLKTLDALFYSRSMATYMENIITRHNSDIIDFHWVFPDGIGGLEWARKLGKKTVVTVRGNEAIHFFERDEVRKIIQRKLSYFDHVVTVSTDLKTKILADYSVDPSKVTVISNGIDSEKFFLMDKLEARSMCGLHTDQKYIITICRLSKEKGLDHLLKSFAKLDSQQTRLIIIGDGPLKVSLITLSETLGIADRVDFHGVIDHREACAWYNAADIFCLPSLWEGCPNVVIESLACGTPVVASNVGGIPDLISGDDYGYLVPPGDADALSSALENALNHSWNNFNISKFGSSHSWDHVAEKVIKVYERVLV